MTKEDLKDNIYFEINPPNQRTQERTRFPGVNAAALTTTSIGCISVFFCNGRRRGAESSRFSIKILSF